MAERPQRQTKAPKPVQKVPHGKMSEKRVSKMLGSRLTPSSGAMEGAKGDAQQVVKKHKILYESKSTTSDSMQLQKGWLDKIAGEAVVKGALPAVTVSFVTPDGKAKGGDWVMLRLVDLQELLEALGRD